MTVQLPQELIDHILAYISGDRRSLYHASLASPAFTTTCQNHLFRHLKLDHGDPAVHQYHSFAQNAAIIDPDVLANILESSPHLAVHIQQLCLVQHTLSMKANALAYLLPRLSELKILEYVDVGVDEVLSFMDAVDPDVFTLLLNESCSHFHRVHTIAVDGIEEFPVMLLSHYSSIKNFSITGPFVESVSVPCDPSQVSPVRLTTIKGDSLITTLYVIPFSAATLTRIEWKLRRVFPTLVWLPLADKGLGKLTALRELVIETDCPPLWNSSYYIQLSTTVISCLSPLAPLSCIQIHTRGLDPLATTPATWQDLARALASRCEGKGLSYEMINLEFTCGSFRRGGHLELDAAWPEAVETMLHGLMPDVASVLNIRCYYLTC